MKSKPRTGFKRWLWSSFWVLLLALVVHVTYAVWPWPEFRGGAALEAVLRRDWARLSPLMSEPFTDLLQLLMQGVYQVFFVFTGLDYLVGRALDPTPITDTGGEGLRVLVLTAWKYFLEPVYWSLQIITLRTAALFSLFPLFLVAGMVGAINGWIGRYLRRTGGGKESGYIYHRAKIGLWLCLSGIWVVYLIPPVSINLQLLLPPFLLSTLAGVWVVVHWFKKQL